MKNIVLNAQPRSVIGRKVKQLRSAGVLPANIYGKNLTSVAVEITQDAFNKAYQQAGETSVVNLQVADATHPVLIKDVVQHPLTGAYMHVDFYQVDLKEKVTANVPVQIIGSAPAVDQKIGVLLELTDEIEVEALPTDLPEHIEVDVTKLTAIGDTIKVADLVLPPGVVATTDPETEVVKIDSLVSKEAEEQAKAEEAAAAEAAAAAGTTEGAAPAEGATPAEPAAAEKPAEEAK